MVKNNARYENVLSSLTLRLQNDECSPLSILSRGKVQYYVNGSQPVKDKKMRYYVNESRKKGALKLYSPVLTAAPSNAQRGTLMSR